MNPYYVRTNDKVELTETGQYTLDYLGLTLDDLKVMTPEQLKVHCKQFSDALNDGRVTKSRASGYDWRDSGNDNPTHITHNIKSGIHYPDSGSFSRYFSLDAWFDKKLAELPESVQKTFPFLICPKPSKREKNEGLGVLPKRFTKTMNDGIGQRHHNENEPTAYNHNFHPTVKAIKLMSYLITLGSREGDIILDPFAGSGTTGLAATLLNRKYILCELEPTYCRIAEERLKQEALPLLDKDEPQELSL